MTRYFLTAAAAFALILPAAASAHSKLVSSNPAADATVAKPTKLSLTFSETFLAPMSGAELVMTGSSRHADQGFQNCRRGQDDDPDIPARIARRKL
jgi:methionine-rich copper-binding protein CopC